MTKTTITDPTYDIIKESYSSYNNITLNGQRLKADKITSIFAVKRKINSNNRPKVISKDLVDEIVEPVYFELVEVAKEDLVDRRRKKVPSFVLKMDGKFYYTSIPNEMNLVSSGILGRHKCAAIGHECHRLSAASDEQGGCAKVRDRSRCIERYPWITSGYETFNTKHDAFVVLSCLHYEPCPPRAKLSREEIRKFKIGLAQFVWDDIESREESHKRAEKNKLNYRYDRR